MPPNLNRQGPTPIFEQITHWMRQKIHTSEWANDHKLMSESDLASAFNVSRGTIRKAIENLITEKLLVRIHGKGTYVRNKVLLEQQPNWRLAGFSQDLISRGISYSTEVLTKEIVTPKNEIQDLLNLQPTEKIFHMYRLRKINDQPVLLIENHIAYEHCAGIETIDFTENQLYVTLEEQFKIQFNWARRSYKSINADKAIAKHLKLKSEAAVMFLEEHYHSIDNKPLEYTRAWFDGQVFYIKAIIKRADEKSDLTNIFH